MLGAVEIDSGNGGFTGPVANADFFGSAVASLGDLDGDGVPDLAVGAPGADDGGSGRGSVWILLMNPGGSVKAEQKISATAGGFAGVVDDQDQFGQSLAALGDLDGDGIGDLAVGADLDDDGGSERGAVWILFLDHDGSVKSHQKISATVGGFSGALADGDQFGIAIAKLDDLDGDGVVDIAVGAHRDGDGGPARGAVWILFLETDGSVRAQQKISALAGGFLGTLQDGDLFGISLAGLPDLDGNGVPDLAVGATQDDDGGPERGAVWILFLEANGMVSGEQKISDLAGGFAGVLDDGDLFGRAVARVHDLDGDGRDDLAVGAIQDDDGGSSRGAVWLLFLRADGQVSGQRKISATIGGFAGPLVNGDRFGSALAELGDLDGDLAREVAVGAIFASGGGALRGATWVLSLDAALPAVPSLDLFGAIGLALAVGLGGLGALRGRRRGLVRNAG